MFGAAFLIVATWCCGPVMCLGVLDLVRGGSIMLFVGEFPTLVIAHCAMPLN